MISVEVLHRHAVAAGGEEVVDVVLEAHARAGVLRTADRVESFDGGGIDDGGAGAAAGPRRAA